MTTLDSLPDILLQKTFAIIMALVSSFLSLTLPVPNDTADSKQATYVEDSSFDSSVQDVLKQNELPKKQSEVSAQGKVGKRVESQVKGNVLGVSFVPIDTDAPEANQEVAFTSNDETQINTEPENAFFSNPNITGNQSALSISSTELHQGDSYEVIAVVDGDTIKVAMGGGLETLRIIGINTPETVDPRRPVQCFGKEASNKAKEMLLGKRVVLEADGSQQDRDKYRRLLRYVFVDGVDYGKEMIREGYAYEYTYNIPYMYQREYKEAQSQARTEARGLWNAGTCAAGTIVAVASTHADASETGAYYTSSSANATSYYPASCEAWKNLSKTYLQSFQSIDDLLAKYPGRVLSKQCS